MTPDHLSPSEDQGQARRQSFGSLAERLDLAGIRGRLTPNAALAPFTWFRVGGPAEVLFQPADADDLALLLGRLEPGSPGRCRRRRLESPRP